TPTLKALRLQDDGQYYGCDQRRVGSLSTQLAGRELPRTKWDSSLELAASNQDMTAYQSSLLPLTQRLCLKKRPETQPVTARARVPPYAPHIHIWKLQDIVADIAVWAAIRGNPIALSLVRKLYRSLEPWITEAIKDLTFPEMKERARERAPRSAAGSSFDVVDLPQVDGPMVTRFPPEPSDYLHIGHTKTALLNDYFAHQKHGGVLICRFDDTNPSNEPMDFQNSITEDLALIDIIPDMTSHSSDYFQQMHDLAVQLIKDGKAFADDSELGKGDDSRKNRLPSKHRDMGIEETLARFEEMKTGSTEGQRWCIRARIAYDSPNGTLRDPVIYCCNLTKHHRTGTSWKYEWIQSTLGLRPVPSWDFSRLNFVRTVLSKRKLTRIVNEGKVWDWSDPRMPTIGGIIRRGVTVPVLREFILKQGPIPANRKHIDPISPRHVAIAADDVVYCDVIDKNNHGSPPDTAVHEVPKYVKNTSLGPRKIQTGRTIVIEQGDARSFELGETITLMNWGNAVVRDISMIPRDAGAEASGSGDVPDLLFKHFVLDCYGRQDDLVELMAFDHLITKDTLEPTDVLEECLTPVTQFTTRAFADCNVVDPEKGAVIQFERKAYYRLDAPYQGRVSSLMVFFEIPSGGK
ncbi:putative glutamate--tRNA ligase, cytoplasmic, partial [Talaromyces pinophilus]